MIARSPFSRASAATAQVGDLQQRVRGRLQEDRLGLRADGLPDGIQVRGIDEGGLDPQALKKSREDPVRAPVDILAYHQVVPGWEEQ